MDTVANVSAQQGVVTVEYVGTAMDHGTGSEKTLLGVVLAGGRSSRMGQDKALLELLDGTTLLECQLRRLSSLVPEVVLSVRDRNYAFLQKRLTACGRVRLLPDETDEVGPLGGIASALGEAEREHFAGILAGPFVSQALIPANSPHASLANLLRISCHSWGVLALASRTSSSGSRTSVRQCCVSTALRRE